MNPPEAWRLKISLFGDWGSTVVGAGIPEPGQMGGSRAVNACGMLKCLRFGHARYTQDSRSRREGSRARVSYPVA